MKRLIDDFRYTHDELAEILGISRSCVSNQLRLLKLDERLQHWMMQGEMTESHGKVLASLKHDQQYSIAYKAMAHRWSVRVLERAVEEIRAGKPSSAIEEVVLAELTIEAKEAAKKIGYQFGCAADVVLRKNNTGYFQIKFTDANELKRLNSLITDWCLLD